MTKNVSPSIALQYISVRFTREQIVSLSDYSRLSNLSLEEKKARNIVAVPSVSQRRYCHWFDSSCIEEFWGKGVKMIVRWTRSCVGRG